MPFLDHLPELMIVLVVGALVFGTKRLPEMGSAVAQTIKSFQHGIKEVTAAHDEPTPTPLPSAVLPATTPEPIALPSPTPETSKQEVSTP